MATGPNPILAQLGEIEGFAHRAEHAITGAFRHHHHEPHPTPETPATIKADTPEVPAMPSLLDEIKNDIATLAAKAEHLDADAATKVTAIKATPEGAEAFEIVAQLYDATVPPEVRAAASAILKGAALLVPAAQPAADTAVPEAFAAGPQVAGQA